MAEPAQRATIDSRATEQAPDDNDYLTSAELYDPATGFWSRTGDIGIGRGGHKAILLLDGKVLIVGGYNGTVLASSELYDPASGAWNATGNLNTPRWFHTALAERWCWWLAVMGHRGTL